MESVKRLREDSQGDNDANGQKDNEIFEKFRLDEVLSEHSDAKRICVRGNFEESDKNAVVILEKQPFTQEVLSSILSSASNTTSILQNDIYKTYSLYPKPECNGIKTTLIYPATAKHIEKYRKQKLYMITETTEDYANITLPYLQATSFSIQWVYNILEKKQEAERIVAEDDDADTGFVLLPDMKWDGKIQEDLYLVAITHRRDIKSIRDLNDSHLPLLNNILQKGTQAINDKYGVPSHKLRIYFHYQPSYYHLHIHFTHLHNKPPGTDAERAHLLPTVIQNITMQSDYYSKVALTYALKANDGLCLKYKEAGRLD